MPPGRGAKDSILWEVANDVQEMVLAVRNDGSVTKTLGTLASIIYDCSQESGVPDIKLKFFTLTPTLKMVEGREQQAFYRFGVAQENQGAALYPRMLTDDEMAADMVKSGALGAVWAGKYNNMPSAYTKVLWDVEFKRTPPAALRPVKPKMWLMCSTRLEKDFYYELP